MTKMAISRMLKMMAMACARDQPERTLRLGGKSLNECFEQTERKWVLEATNESRVYQRFSG